MNIFNRITTLVFLLLFTTLISAQTSYTSVLSGEWDNPTVWSPSGVPGAGDNVYIDQQTIVSTNGQREVAGFSTLVGGELALTGIDGSLTITGTANWGGTPGGGIIRDVTSNNNGVVTIASGAVLHIDGNQWSAGLYGGARLLNQGTVRMVSNFGIWGKDSSVIENQGLFEIDPAGNFSGFPNGGIFINTSSGIFRKSSGMGACNFSANWEFQNLGGTIDVQSGSVTFNCDGIFNGGSYNADAGALIHFDAGNQTFEGTLSGAPAGRIEISAGVTANTGTTGVTFDFQGTGLAWSGGTFTGSMITIPNNSLLVLDEFSFASVLSNGSTLLNMGTIRQDENLGIRALDLSIVDNQSLYEIVADNASFGGNPNGGIFINTGTLRNMGAGTCNFNANWEFHNLGGTIDVQTGEVAFKCDGIFNGGSYHAAAGAALHFDSGNHTFEGTISGAPAGNIELSIGVTADVGASGLTLDLQGTGFNWSSGTFTGTASTLIVNTGLIVLTYDQASLALTGGLTLRNQGTIRQLVNPGLSAQDSSIVDNQGLFEIDTENGSFSGSGLGGVFINSGIFRKVSGTGISFISSSWQFQNLAGGVIDAASGELDFGNLDNAPGAIIQGVASIDVHTVFTNNGITAPGNSPGTLTYIGNFLPSATGVLEIELAGLNPGSEHDQLSVTGNANLNGTLDITTINGFIPTVGDSFVILTTTSTVADSFSTVILQDGLYATVNYNSNNVTIVVDSVGTIVSVDDDLEASIVTDYVLNQNYPNPFNPSTTIQYQIPEAQFVSINVYNTLGEVVANLVNEQKSAGNYTVNFDASNFSSGVYFYQIRTNNFTQVKKMLLTK